MGRSSGSTSDTVGVGATSASSRPPRPRFASTTSAGEGDSAGGSSPVGGGDCCECASFGGVQWASGSDPFAGVTSALLVGYYEHSLFLTISKSQESVLPNT